MTVQTLTLPMEPQEGTWARMFPFRERFAMNPPCCGSGVLRFACDVVILPRIWRREPPSNVFLQFFTCETIVSSFQHLWPVAVPSKNNSRLDLLILLEISCNSSTSKLDNDLLLIKTLTKSCPNTVCWLLVVEI